MIKELASNTTQNVKGESARNIWGKIIIYLREHHAVALHIACGDIVDVSFDGETFLINTTDTFLYELLKQDENMKDLTNAFNNFNIKKFDIIKKEKILTKSQEDILKLKQVFGDKLIIE